MREAEDLDEADVSEGPAAPSTTTTPSPRRIIDISLERLHESPFNRRRTWGNLEELAESISEVGVLEPLLARPHKKEGHYELVFGHRRYRASKIAKAVSAPCIVRDLTDAQAVEIQVVENLQRTDIHPLEEAEGYEQLMKIAKVAVDDLAARVGKSRAYVYSRMKLLALCEKARKAFAKDDINASVALYIARIPSEKQQVEALRAVMGSGDQWDPPLSAREAKRVIEEQFMLRLNDAPFDLADALLIPKAGACTTCPKRTGNQAELFADVEHGDVCTDTTCFDSKKLAHGKRRLELAKSTGLAVVSGKDADKAVSAAGQYDGKSVDLDGVCYQDSKRRTFRALLKKSETAVTTTVAQKTDGEVHELAPRAEVAKAIAKLVKVSRPSKDTGAVTRNDEEKKRRAAAARRRVKTLAVVGAVVATAEKKVDGEAVWPFLAELLIGDVRHEIALEVCKRRGIEIGKSPHGGHPDPRRALAKAFKAMTSAQAKGLVVELVAGTRGTFGFGLYSSDATPALSAAVAFYKVDAAKVGGEALKRHEAEKAAKKKPARGAR